MVRSDAGAVEAIADIKSLNKKRIAAFILFVSMRYSYAFEYNRYERYCALSVLVNVNVQLREGEQPEHGQDDFQWGGK